MLAGAAGAGFGAGLGVFALARTSFADVDAVAVPSRFSVGKEEAEPHPVDAPADFLEAFAARIAVEATTTA